MLITLLLILASDSIKTRVLRCNSANGCSCHIIHNAAQKAGESFQLVGLMLKSSVLMFTIGLISLLNARKGFSHTALSVIKSTQQYSKLHFNTVEF